MSYYILPKNNNIIIVEPRIDLTILKPYISHSLYNFYYKVHSFNFGFYNLKDNLKHIFLGLNKVNHHKTNILYHCMFYIPKDKKNIQIFINKYFVDNFKCKVLYV